jgi:hypothetical protein
MTQAEQEQAPKAGRLHRFRTRSRWFSAEILVIVAGVLIALGIDSWWQERQDAKSETVYLRLIMRDLEQMAGDLEELVGFEETRLEAGLAVYRTLSAGPAPEAERQSFSRDITSLLSRRTIRATDATFQDLLSTGGLRLLRNLEIRHRLIAYYEEAERAFQIHNRNNAVFVDELFVREMLGRGLVYNRIGSSLSARAESDEMLRDQLEGGFIEDPDPLWDLPMDSPAWNTVRAILLQRIAVAAYARQFAAEQLADTRALQAAIEAVLPPS